MSDIPPPLSMIPPGSTPSYPGPKLYYDHAGNAFTRDNDGAWESHPGICNVSLIKRLSTGSQYSSYYRLLHLIGPVGSNMATVWVIRYVEYHMIFLT